MTDLILLTLQDIPGSGKFKKRSLQNEEDMRIMFGDITNDESDHWNPMSSNPIIPPSRDDVYDIPEDVDGGDEFLNNDGVAGDETINDEEVDQDEEMTPSPSIILGKKRGQGGHDKVKKQRVGRALVIQEAVTKIAENASSFTSITLGQATVQQVMDMVLECGQAMIQMNITLQLNYLSRRTKGKCSSPFPQMRLDSIGLGGSTMTNMAIELFYFIMFDVI